ncbi:MAG: Sigma-70, region 4 [Pseudomonadota bacterium]|jgi:DNA-directed RNA polymerase sigma subunit (sigma70/sigma32)
MTKLISNKKQADVRVASKQRGLTLQEVADCFGITKERVRQIEARALQKVRVALAIKGTTLNQMI